MNWYALVVQANCEKLVAESLRGLAAPSWDGAPLISAGDSVEAYYPHVLVKSRDHKREVEKKFFPGYVFARFEFERRLPVLQTPHVARILGWDPTHPAVISESEIEAVRQMVDSCVPSSPVTSYPFMSEGDLVRVTGGPFLGQEGFVVYEGAKARVVVSVTAMGGSISVEVDAANVELLERENAQKAA
jgi:transcription antitermination factor NusG